jgi:phosphoribosyl-ATP pyrophosphohydrolase
MRFKPSINQIIADYNMDRFLVIPKNSGLNGALKETLEDMGLRGISADKEFFEAGDPAVKVMRCRGEDVPKIVEELYFTNRVKAVGMTGDDLFDEYSINNKDSVLSLLETIDWYEETAKYKRPTLCLMVPQGKTLQGKVRVAVNAKYEKTSRMALDEIAAEMGIEPEVRVYAGGTELTVAQGLNDASIEIVDTGKSLTEYNLNPVKKIRFSDFAVIGVDEANPKILKITSKQIADRVLNPREGSYTSRITSTWNEMIKKAAVETGELVAELAKYSINPSAETKDRIINEAGDVLYSLQASLAKAGIPFDAVIRQEYMRYKRD